MKLSDYAKQVGVTYKTAYKFEAIHPSDTVNDLVDDFVAVITSMETCIYGQRNAKLRVAQIRVCVQRCIEQAETTAKTP